MKKLLVFAFMLAIVSMNTNAQYASRSLNNLTSPTRINVDLLPKKKSIYNLGSASLSWNYIYAGGGYYITDKKVIDISGISNTFLGATGNTLNIGQFNVFVGADAGAVNSTGVNNAANGARALFANTTGFDNTADGSFALQANTIGMHNTVNGSAALYANTTGVRNTGSGYGALYRNTEGGANTAVGFGATVDSGTFTNTTVLGNSALATASNQVRVGDKEVTSIGGYVDWSTISDGRVKRNIKPDVPGLSFINQLQPVTYNLDLDAADQIVQPRAIKDQDGNTIQPMQEELIARKAKEQMVYTGFVAQDVEAAAKKIGYDFSGMDVPKNDKDLYALRYADFVVPLVKAVQELSAANDEKDKKIDALQKQIDELRTAISNQHSAMSTEPEKSAVGNSQSAALEQNAPNPLDHSTTIAFRIPQHYTSASIVITEASSGQTVKTIPVSGNEASIRMDASSFANGSYSYSLIVDGKVIDTKTMIISR